MVSYHVSSIYLPVFVKLRSIMDGTTPMNSFQVPVCDNIISCCMENCLPGSRLFISPLTHDPDLKSMTRIYLYTRRKLWLRLTVLENFDGKSWADLIYCREFALGFVYNIGYIWTYVTPSGRIDRAAIISIIISMFKSDQKAKAEKPWVQQAAAIQYVLTCCSWTWQVWSLLKIYLWDMQTSK